MRGNKNINPILLKTLCAVCACRDFDIFPPRARSFTFPVFLVLQEFNHRRQPLFCSSRRTQRGARLSWDQFISSG
jgi:hypothetical protein